MNKVIYLVRNDIKEKLSKFAQERVEQVLQEEDSKRYYVQLKEGYVFKGMLIKEEIRGYGAIPCKTISEIKEWCRQVNIQEGKHFELGDEDLAEIYLRQVKFEPKKPKRVKRKKINSYEEYMAEVFGLRQLY